MGYENFAVHKGATEEMPFKEPYFIFKVLGKWFALVPLDDEELNISLKSDPDKVIGLRDEYNCAEAA